MPCETCAARPAPGAPACRYVWDRALRKYVDKELYLQQGAAGTAGAAGKAGTAGTVGDAAASVSYDDMVYAGDDEVVPSLQVGRGTGKEGRVGRCNAVRQGMPCLTA